MIGPVMNVVNSVPMGISDDNPGDYCDDNDDDAAAAAAAGGGGDDVGVTVVQR